MFQGSMVNLGSSPRRRDALVRRTAAILLVVVCILVSGCGGLLSGSDSNETTVAPTTEQPTDTPVETPSLSPQEREFVRSGEGFANSTAQVLELHNRTEFVESKAYPNNTVELTVRVTAGTPLNRSMMETAQATAAISYMKSVEGTSIITDGGDVVSYIRPEMVEVTARGPNGGDLGTFQVNPTRANEYRAGYITPHAFAESVTESFESQNAYPGGLRSTKYYLNQSELSIWVRDYQDQLLRSTAGEFDEGFPVENVRTNASTHEVLHEFEWSLSEYGQASLSASVAVHEAYWNTTADSWGMAPTRLNHFMHLPHHDKNYAGHMDRRYVYWFLDTDRDSFDWYFYRNESEGGYVPKGTNPFEDDF